jgi:hypothetical protein
VSWQHTIAADATCLVIGQFAYTQSGVPNATVNGVAARKIRGEDVLLSSFGVQWGVLHVLMNPPTGTVTVGVSVGVFAGFGCGGVSVSYKNVRRVGEVVGFRTAGGPAFGSVTSTYNDCVVPPGGAASILTVGTQGSFNSMTGTLRTGSTTACRMSDTFTPGMNPLSATWTSPNSNAPFAYVTALPMYAV